MAASSSRLRTVEDGSFGPIRASETDDLAFHLATVFGLIPYRRQQIVAILVQAINGARIFGTVFLGEGLECKAPRQPGSALSRCPAGLSSCRSARNSEPC